MNDRKQISTVNPVVQLHPFQICPTILRFSLRMVHIKNGCDSRCSGANALRQHRAAMGLGSKDMIHWL